MRALRGGNGADYGRAGGVERAGFVVDVAACRLCGGSLTSGLDLGLLAQCGRFPAPGEPDDYGPLDVVQCAQCGLAQLGSAFNPRELFGPGYGYASSLNASMVAHLERIVHAAQKRAGLRPGDIVIDIGANDGTLLSLYDVGGLHRVAVDPLAEQYRDRYPDGSTIYAEFFDWRIARAFAGKAKIITSIAMFYDLADPLDFARQVMHALHPDGLWVLEHSTLRHMLQSNAWDSICHEHVEYYSLLDIARIAESVGAKICEIAYSGVNGGSTRTVLAHRRSAYPEAIESLKAGTVADRAVGIGGPRPLRKLAQAVERTRDRLRETLCQYQAAGKRVLGYGASTKGNTLLQVCGIGRGDLEAIADVNPTKWGRETPGTRIPIVSEALARDMEPDAYLVLPWHFRDAIVERERDFLKAGGELIFPLPEVEIVSA